MTANQIKRALKKANISLEGLEISRDSIEVCVGYYEKNGYGCCDEEATAKKQSEIASAMPRFSGCYSTGYGALICNIDYKETEEDYNDVCSTYHY